MIKKTITYEGFDDNTYTEDFYFHLFEHELIELQLSEKGGFYEFIKQIIADEDGKTLVETFKMIILMSYGKKSPDGKGFDKSDEFNREFTRTNAYSKLFTELATDAGAAAEFIRGLVPADLGETMAEIEPEKAKDEETPAKKPQDMSREELIEAMRTKLAE